MGDRRQNFPINDYEIIVKNSKAKLSSTNSKQYNQYCSILKQLMNSISCSETQSQEDISTQDMADPAQVEWEEQSIHR